MTILSIPLTGFYSFLILLYQLKIFLNQDKIPWFKENTHSFLFCTCWLMRIIGLHPLITFLYVFVGSYHGFQVVIMFGYWTSAQEFIDAADRTISTGSNSTLHCVAILGALPEGRSLSSKSETPTKCEVLNMDTKKAYISSNSGELSLCQARGTKC